MKITEVEKEFVKLNYGILSYKEIGKILDIKPARVKRIAHMVIENRTAPGKSNFSRSKTKFNCNSQYFCEPNQQNSYWAGFIAADGCIIKSKSDNSQRQLCIQLQENDLPHLEQFKKDIDFDGKIGVYETTYTYKGISQDKRFCSLKLTSDIICDSLENNFKITPSKSLTLEPPVELDKDNSLAFIKGYIDGDGWVQKKTSKQWKSHISMVGTLEVLLWIQSVVEVSINEKLSEKCIGKRPGESNSYSLTITGNKARKLLSLLCGIERGLFRKWDGIKEVSSSYQDPRIKFTDTEIEDILYKISKKVSQKEIAKEYNVHQVCISQIRLRKRKWLQSAEYDCLYNKFKERI